MKFGETVPKGKLESVTVAKEKELRIENKKQIARMWSEMILGCDVAGTNFDKMEDTELKRWLAETLSEEIGKTRNEFGIKPEDPLLEKIKNSTNVEEKAELQKEYILDCQDKMQAFVEEFKKREYHSTRWVTMPLLMNEYKSFNCVGASMIGRDLLEKAGIESYFGKPTGHVVNIARLANGDWWYADFLNNRSQVRKIEPKIKKICGIDTLEINERDVIYKYVHLTDGSGAVDSILRNMDCLKYEADDPEIPDDLPEKKIAKEYLTRFDEYFSEIDFEGLHDRLFPEMVRLLDSDEIRDENKRVGKMQRIYGEIFPAIKKSYELSKWKSIIGEAKNNLGLVERFFYQDDNEALLSLSDDLKEVLKKYSEKMVDLKTQDEETYFVIVDSMISSIAASKQES
jgi:hypothetical protein